ncbi:hypothetical protein BAUCODRAFT_23611 [Baudoinia panamericana UAMH 10762]|uniref:Ubiquitin 3 binding protein But2 C-terminal domain-containing protein n=1 Tax=Baudoinia panamericana (strain UAMH 10762) TaxID=717646 RepID=M2LS42_BAUPA|nr:uncharacterized protein BAUCODRAFT_23611 [Baudoinia panamericana UAMH 10762]EMC97287.1 hypothetical protein BAUCODRAFT_23611 [Baudoinia panamericana UAMH 10762]
MHVYIVLQLAVGIHVLATYKAQYQHVLVEDYEFGQIPAGDEVCLAVQETATLQEPWLTRCRLRYLAENQAAPVRFGNTCSFRPGRTAPCLSADAHVADNDVRSNTARLDFSDASHATCPDGTRPTAKSPIAFFLDEESCLAVRSQANGECFQVEGTQSAPYYFVPHAPAPGAESL